MGLVKFMLNFTGLAVFQLFFSSYMCLAVSIFSQSCLAVLIFHKVKKSQSTGCFCLFVCLFLINHIVIS